jgi:alpha-glucuronidase
MGTEPQFSYSNPANNPSFFRFSTRHKRRVPQVRIFGPGNARFSTWALFLAFVLATTLQAPAQTADHAWLRYRLMTPSPDVPFQVVSMAALSHVPPGPVFMANPLPSPSNSLEFTAEAELARGLRALTGEDEDDADKAVGQKSHPRMVLLGTREEMAASFPKVNIPPLGPEDSWLFSMMDGDAWQILVVGGSERGIVYGSFALLRRISMGEDMHKLSVVDHPAFPIRWVDEWDNPDGSIERGYAGRSIFFEGGNVRADLAPVAEYARLLASVGINGCNINNVNAAP